MALSADGTTLAVGSYLEDAQGENSGAVYVFSRSGAGWSQQAYLTAPNAGAGDFFGSRIALSGDGNTLAVGAHSEDSDTRVIGGPDNNNANDSGAAYVFTRSNGAWSYQAYIKASNAAAGDWFGTSVALSADGNTLVVGAFAKNEKRGAAYVFARSASVWGEQRVLTVSAGSPDDYFGASAALSSDGNKLAIGALESDVPGQGRGGTVYVFNRTGTAWSDPAPLRAPNSGVGDIFGWSVALSADGTTLAVGAPREDSASAGSGPNDNSALDCGAVYAFTWSRSGWGEPAYLKASNSGARDEFGAGVALSGDGSILAIGAGGEASAAAGSNPNDNSAFWAGAAYVFSRAGTTWKQQTYLKASNAGVDPYGDQYADTFGDTVALSTDGVTFAAGARREDSSASGINGDPNDNNKRDSGAVYVFY